MEGTIQTLSFNPVTNKLFVGTSRDSGIFTPATTGLERQVSKSKVSCSDWSTDGRLLAYGTASGSLHILDSQMQPKANVKKLSGLTCVRWSPITEEMPDLVIIAACVDQTISLHREDGAIVGFEKKVKFEVHAIDWFSTAEYFLAAGSGGIIGVFSREVVLLQEIETGYNWIWSLKFQQTANVFACGGNNGQIKLLSFDRAFPITFSEEMYASRVGMTEVVIKDLNSDRKAKFRCKELIKNISLYKEHLALHTSSRILLYQQYNLYGEGDQQMHTESFSYKPVGKLELKVDGYYFRLLAENFVLCKENRVSCYDFNRNLTREWLFDSNVTFLKILGGPPKEECLVAGLKNGNCYKLFLSNPFPILLIEHGVEITSMDLSISRKLLGLVDSKDNFYLYDVQRKESLSSELKIKQCCFSQDFETIYAVAGETVIYVKSLEFDGVSVPATGFMIGFKGNKVRLANRENISSIEIPFTGFLSQSLAKKDFAGSYRIACMGLSDSDVRHIGMEALKGKEFVIARKCFTWTQDLEYLDVVTRAEEENRSGKFDDIGLQVELLCYDKKIPKAIELLKKEGQLEKAIELCITMRKWAEAMDLIKSAQSSGKLKNDKFNIFKLLKMQADSENMKGNWRAAADLMISANQEAKAAEIYIKYDQEEQVVQLMRKLNKGNHSDALRECVKYFVGKKNHNAGKEALLKLGDQEELMRFHVELERWDEAKMLATSDENLKPIMVLPYAEWLSKKNRFDEASEYYKMAGRVDLAMEILHKLSEMSIVQERFKEAGQFHWILAKETLKSVSSFKSNSVDDQDKIKKFDVYLQMAYIFQAYNAILRFIRCPIPAEDYPGANKGIFNASRFIMAHLRSPVVTRVASSYQISMAKVNYVLAKLANNYGGYKLARVAFDKLQSFVLSPEWVEEVEAQALISKSKPMKDSLQAGYFCPRCRVEVQILTDGATCGNCYYPLVISPLKFENLPLVEFKVTGETSHEKVLFNYKIMEQLGTDLAGAHTKAGSKKKGNGKMWDFNVDQQGQDDEAINVDKERLEAMEADNTEYNTRFGDKISEVGATDQTCDLQIGSNGYMKVTIDVGVLKTLDPDEVFVQDFRSFCRDYPVRYFKNMQKGVDIMSCPSCQQFFTIEEFDLYFNQHKTCPFCNSQTFLNPK
jgi:intraflagellar transport protein 122